MKNPFRKEPEPVVEEPPALTPPQLREMTIQSLSAYLDAIKVGAREKRLRMARFKKTIL